MSSPFSLPPSPVPRFLPLFLVALGARLGTVALGALLATTPPHIEPPFDPDVAAVNARLTSAVTRPIEPWYRWDGRWVANVALNGYGGASDRGGRLGVAFMPAAPFALALGDAVGLNPYWFALTVVNLAGAAGASVFARVAARQLNDAAAGWGALALLLTFPTAFFFSAPYNESFGLLFTALALSAWQVNRPAAAGLSAACGSLARLTGPALGVAALVDWLGTRERAKLPRALALALGSFGGLALFCGYLWWAVGDPLAGLKSQAAWGRPELSWKNLLLAVRSIYDPVVPHWGEAAVVFAAALLGVRAWAKRGAFWGVIVLVPVAQMFLSGTFLSAHRVILAALPAFIELADLLRTNPARRFAVAVAFGAIQFVLLNRYLHWQFAG
ncbi:MAG: hypothetical protein FJ304_06190 [Planctomycetes bacterium]|nr:hypothetical protein [Planctomycetota bacterium]